MKNKEDNIIQIILDQLCLSEYKRTNHKLISKVHSDAFRGDEKIIYNKLIDEYKLIKRKENQRLYFRLTEKGDKVQKAGGWTKYKNKQLSEIEEELINQQKEKDLIDINLKLAQSNIYSNIENSKSIKTTIRNSTISVWIGGITGVALIVQILILIFSGDKDQLKVQEYKIEELSKQQDTLESKFDALTSSRQEVVQDTIDKNDN